MVSSQGKYRRTMYNWVTVLIFAAAVFRMGAAQAAENPLPTQVVDLSGVWKGQADKDNRGESLGYAKAGFDDSSWREVVIPCNFEPLGPGMDEFRGTCWFRRSFVVPNSWRNQRVIIRFEGINNQGDIWLNGKKIGQSVDAFLPYELTISDDVQYGHANTLVVRVNNEAPVSGMPTFFGWRSEGGILRGVALTAGSFCYMQEASINAEPVPDGGVLKLTVNVNNKMARVQSVQARIKIFDQAGGFVCAFATDWAKVKGHDGASLQSTVSVPGVKWWSPEQPNLYNAQIELAAKKGEPLDSRVVRFGFRSIQTQGNQILLNGTPVYLVGFNRHEDSYRTGMASDLSLTRQDLTDMKRMGANFIRLCHYPHDTREIDLCDELGLLVMCEIPFYMTNLLPGSIDITQKENNALVAQSAQRQLTMMIDRDRNHPSVIFWSVGNENREGLAEVRQIIGDMVQLAKKLDPSRLATHVSIQGFWDKPEIDTHPYDDVVSVNCYGYMNYGEKNGDYLERALGTVHGKYPNKPLLITEYGAWEIKRGQLNEGQVQATAIESDYRFFAGEPYICGAIVWCYADHRWPPRAFIPEADGVSPYGVYKRDRTPGAAVKVVEKIFGQQYRERQQVANSSKLVLSCTSDNDLLGVLRANGIECQHVETPQEAVETAAENGGVMILADGYPQACTKLDEGVYQLASRKKLRLYVEYPSMAMGLKTDAPKHFRTGPYGVRYDRAVIASDFFSPALPERSLLEIQDCYYVPMAVVKPHMVLARVVGYNQAVLGLPTDVVPILFEHPENRDVLISTTKLSQFITGRYMPTDVWGPMWQRILEWLVPGQTAPSLKWSPTVVARYDAKEKLPPDAQLQAVRRSANWLINSRLLVDESWKPQTNPTGIKDAIPRDWKVGDGSRGIAEAFDDYILFDGRQTVCRDVRADCTTESAMVLAAGSQLFKDDHHRQVCQNLIDYVFSNSSLCQGPRIDPASPTYGLIGWAESVEPGKQNMYWGDDNARCVLATMAAAAMLKTDRWDEPIIRGILANFRTTGPLGFRGGLLKEDQIQADGWQHYWKTERVNYSPHYEAYLWGTYLWLYDKTGYKPLLDRAKAGIYRMMEAYPGQWAVECGRMEAERARMILPLAWLVRVEDTPQHRQWLDEMIQYFVTVQDASGAIPQHVDKPYTANEQYGSGEAPIVYQTGDPATDLLYTMNFVLFGLREAACAVGNPEYAALEDRVAEFLVRIQTRCDANPQLDGLWYRSFDFKKWDYWGSDGDLGWGVLVAETGWTQSWIAAGLAMREMKASLWDLTKSSQAGRHFEKYRELMLPADKFEPGPSR